MRTLTELFLTFARIGLVTFGGGYAMIPLIESICVEKKGWITHDEMMDVTVIAESTPGPIAINCATYVGYKRGKLAGAAAATVGMVLPSFCILYVISMFLDRFQEVPWIAHAFMGVRAAVGILIVDAAVRMLRRMPRKPLPLLLAGGAFAAMLAADLFALKLSSVALLLAAGAVGLAVFLWRRPRGGEVKGDD